MENITVRDIMRHYDPNASVAENVFFCSVPCSTLSLCLWNKGSDPTSTSEEYSTEYKIWHHHIYYTENDHDIINIYVNSATLSRYVCYALSKQLQYPGDPRPTSWAATTRNTRH